MDTSTIEAICNYILENINEYIDIDQIANEFHYNKYHLMRKFKEYTGLTINEYLNKNRVYNSVYPLILTDDTILKIALNNGFNSSEYYSEKFKDIIGVGPLKFRKSFSIDNLPCRKENDMTRLEQIKAELEELREYQKCLQEITEKSQETPKVLKLDSRKNNNAA